LPHAFYATRSRCFRAYECLFAGGFGSAASGPGYLSVACHCAQPGAKPGSAVRAAGRLPARGGARWLVGRVAARATVAAGRHPDAAVQWQLEGQPSRGSGGGGH
nr:hypothetical protein [Tanacetum cinerariifolium]